MRKLFNIIAILLVLLTAFNCTESAQNSSADRSSTDNDDVNMSEFDRRAYQLRFELLSNHTYDFANVPIADSLYQESEKVGSDYGKMMALQIKYYVYVADTAYGPQFLETVDEFLDISYRTGDYEAYYDGLSVKVHYFIGKERYIESLSMLREILVEAEKSQDPIGLYFCNSMIGNVYLNRGNNSMAIPYFRKAFEYSDGDSVKHCITARDLSIVYSNIDDYDNAMYYARLACDFAVSEVYKEWTEFQYLQTLYMQHVDDATYLQAHRSSSLYDKDTDGVLPDYLQRQFKIQELCCQHRWNEAIECAQLIEFDNIRDITLSDIYLRMGDYKLVYLTQERIMEYKDSVQTAIQTEDISALDVQLGKSQLELESQMLKARNQQLVFVFIISILIIFGIAAGYVIHRHRRHLKELEQKNAELDRARAEAEQASHVKSIFINNMTHELHTPLNHIYGFAQVLSDENIPSTEAERKEMAKAICDSSQHLTNILDNVIEVSSKLENLTELSDMESVLK